VINLFRDGTKSASNEPLLEGMPVVKEGCSWAEKNLVLKS
jgi:hypothetical protein